jgi:hypothetical protein
LNEVSKRLGYKASDSQQLSGLSLNNPGLIEEVKSNNFAKISRMMNPYMIQKRTSETYTGRET